MPFRIGLSGLNAAQADLKITGNNIANSGTIGFKQSRAEFADVYATTKAGSVQTAIGSGVRLADSAQQFTQGNLLFTENNLDLGITGEGFFTLDDVSGNRVYTRNGQFKADDNGYIVDNSSSNLKGYGIDPISKQIDTGTIIDLQISDDAIAPLPTSTADLAANIDSSEAVIGASGGITELASGAVDPTTYNHTTSFAAFDSLGNTINVSLFFAKTAANTWDVGVKYTDASGATGNNFAAVDVQQITFSDVGVIDSAASSPPLTNGQFTFDIGTSPTLPTGATAPQTITFDMNSLTQYGADFGVTNIEQNGYTTGQLSGIAFDQSGIVTARYTNGKSENLGQVILTGFTNNQGLSQLGDNYWAESYASGVAVINQPGAGNLGLINSGSLEDSNVNLTEQLINLITAQRNFQANAKTITTANQITQTLIQI